MNSSQNILNIGFIADKNWFLGSLIAIPKESVVLFFETVKLLFYSRD